MSGKTLADLDMVLVLFNEPYGDIRPKFRKSMIGAWFHQFGKVCPLCDRVMIKGSKKNATNCLVASIDHIIAVADGGSNELTNLRVICRECNTQKGSVLDTSKRRMQRFQREDEEAQRADTASQAALRQPDTKIT